MSDTPRGFRDPSVFLRAVWLAAVMGALPAACAIDGRAVTVSGDGAGAASGGALFVCEGTPVQRALITDFSDATEGLNPDGKFGIRFTTGPVSQGGVSATFQAPSQTAPQLSLQSTGDNRALHVDAVSKPIVGDNNFYFGFALEFGADKEVCVDATAYRGVGFTLDGTVGTCELRFQVMMSQDERVESFADAATCTLEENCYPPYTDAIPVDGPGSYAFAFTDLVNAGNPIPTVDLRTITNVGWKFYAIKDAPPCEIHLVLDDVAFFK